MRSNEGILNTTFNLMDMQTKSNKTPAKILTALHVRSVEGLNNCDVFWWSNMEATAERREIVKDIKRLANGERWNINQAAKVIFEYAKKSRKNAEKVAGILIDAFTYMDCSDWFDKMNDSDPQFEELIRLRDNYKGFEAWIKCAHEYFIEMVSGKNISVKKALEIFKK